MSNSKVTLGQEVFVLSGRSVVRTMVGRIEGESYSLLNGDDASDPHWFTYGGAVFAACERVKAQKARLRKALRELTAEDRLLEDERYRDSVLSAPYKIVDLRYELERRLRPRTRKNVSVPKMYLSPGQRVYAIITPATSPCYVGMGVYRPLRNFVLETQVKSVCISPDGGAVYTFTTPFVLGEYFLSRKEAMGRLQIHLGPGSLERVYFVSEKLEREELEKLRDDDVPF